MKYWLNGTAYRNFRTYHIHEKFDTYEQALDRASELDMDVDDFEIEYEY